MKHIFVTLSMAISTLVLVVACGKSGSNNSTVGVPNNCSTGQAYSTIGGCLINDSTCGGNLARSQSNGQCYAIESYTGGVNGAYGNQYGGQYGQYGYSNYNSYPYGSYGYANQYANGYYNAYNNGAYGNGYNNGYYTTSRPGYYYNSGLSIWVRLGY